MNRHLIATVCSIAAAFSLAGCVSRSKSPEGYQTLAEDARRDTDRARRENARALELLAKEKLEDAEKALKAALVADVMHGPAHNNLGKLYYRRQKLYLAAWEFQYAIKLMPNQMEPRNNLGLVFETAGKLDDAIKTYEEAAKLESDNIHVIGNLARSKLRRGDKDDTVRQLLSKIVMMDSRPQWVAWAKERLARMSSRP